MMLQQTPNLTIQQGLGLFFITGIIAMIVAAIIVSGLWSREKKRIEKEAEAEGVSVIIDTTQQVDVYAIEGCGYCIVFLVIIILVALGVSFPMVVSEEIEDIVVMIVIIFLGALCWAVTLWAPFYLRNERRRFRRMLDSASRTSSEI